MHCIWWALRKGSKLQRCWKFKGERWEYSQHVWSLKPVSHPAQLKRASVGWQVICSHEIFLVWHSQTVEAVCLSRGDRRFFHFRKLFFHIRYFKDTLILVPQSKEVLGSSPSLTGGSFWVEFECSPCVPGFLWVLWLPPTVQRHVDWC